MSCSVVVGEDTGVVESSSPSQASSPASWSSSSQVSAPASGLQSAGRVLRDSVA